MAEVLLGRAQIAARVEALARKIAPAIDDETLCVALLLGGAWFAADLMRALWALGRDPLFDALWLASYGDARASAGVCEVRAGLQRQAAGRTVLLIDDVFDSGLSLAQAAQIARQAGAARVLTAVFARKPWAGPRPIDPDYVAWEAPDAFLTGYGMDDAGRGRGASQITAA